VNVLGIAHEWYVQSADRGEPEDRKNDYVEMHVSQTWVLQGTYTFFLGPSPRALSSSASGSRARRPSCTGEGGWFLLFGDILELLCTERYLPGHPKG
jgi:hypothetical protein